MCSGSHRVLINVLHASTPHAAGSVGSNRRIDPSQPTIACFRAATCPLRHQILTALEPSYHDAHTVRAHLSCDPMPSKSSLTSSPLSFRRHRATTQLAALAWAVVTYCSAARSVRHRDQPELRRQRRLIEIAVATSPPSCVAATRRSGRQTWSHPWPQRSWHSTLLCRHRRTASRSSLRWTTRPAGNAPGGCAGPTGYRACAPARSCDRGAHRLPRRQDSCPVLSEKTLPVP